MRTVLRSSYGEGNRNVFALTTQNHAEYCKRHGYDYLPVEEKYNPYVDTDMLFKLLDDYDLVVTIGCDVVIQQLDTPVDKFFHRGIVMCKEYAGPTLNADLMLYNGARAGDILYRLSIFQQQRATGQAALNALYGKVPGIYNEPDMQIAAPSMNPKLDYSGVDFTKYFALHYHTLGEWANPPKKYEQLKAAGIGS